MRKFSEASGSRYIQPIITNEAEVLGWHVVLDNTFITLSNEVEVDATLKILGVPLIEGLGFRLNALIVLVRFHCPSRPAWFPSPLPGFRGRSI